MKAAARIGQISLGPAFQQRNLGVNTLLSRRRKYAAECNAAP